MSKRLIDLPKEIFKVPLLERILATLTNNKNPNQFIARLPPLYRVYPKNSFRKVTRNGVKYELDISDYMEWLVFYGIQAEPRNALYQLLKEGDVVFDVGANIGEVTFGMSKRVGNLGMIHSFEPEPFIFSKISRNLSLNSFTNIRLNNVALGDIEQELFLKAQVENNRGGTRIYTNSKEGKKVKVTTLDFYVQQNDLKKLDLIKIDVEGFELKALQGAQEVLQKFKPLLFIEVNDNNLKEQSDSAQSLIEFLFKMGYTKIEHSENKTIITTSTDFSNCHFDIIAQ